MIYFHITKNALKKIHTGATIGIVSERKNHVTLEKEKYAGVLTIVFLLSLFLSFSQPWTTHLKLELLERMPMLNKKRYLWEKLCAKR